jgi:hypothetical protein
LKHSISAICGFDIRTKHEQLDAEVALPDNEKACERFFAELQNEAKG